MIATVEGRRATIAEQRAEDYERWQRDLFEDSRLAPLRILMHDKRHHAEVREDTWQRFRNEKYSRVAERLTETYHERADYYLVDPITGEIIITEADGIKDRYTFRDMYQNGLDKSRELAERDPRFAFQARRDEIFMHTYEQVEAMVRGETDYDTIVAISTFPIELIHNDPDALKAKHYDLAAGKQFAYIFQRVETENGRFMLEMDATTLYSPQEDLQLGKSGGRKALAAVQRSHGVEVPVAMVDSHTQNSFVAAFNAEGRTVKEIKAANVAVYDEALYALTGLKSDHGRTDTAIDAYELFENCPRDWAAYIAFNDMLADHFNGLELNLHLQNHLLTLIDDYRALGKTNRVISFDGLERLRMQVWHGRITPDMAMACNEIMDYAHTALMDRHLTTYKKTGVLPDQTGAAGDLLASYSGDSSGANNDGVSSGKGYDGCEEGNGPVGAAAALAERTGMTLEEALREVTKASSVAYNASLSEKYGAANVRLGPCGACGSHGEIGPCGPGFCNACDTRDRVQRGYIKEMYDRRIGKKGRVAVSKYGEKASVSASSQKPMAGPRIEMQVRLGVGGVEEVAINKDTGLEVA